jgi:MFS family permease
MAFATNGALGTRWLRVALVMFAVGWGANQFSPMLIVYRHVLSLSPGEIAGLFAVYAVTLIPGLLIGGPLSDRLGRRCVVLPFAALSPLATLLLVVGSHDLLLIGTGRALAGLCSGMVFGPATAWVRDVSGGDAQSARRAALALSAGFGLGPVAAALLAQWAPEPLVVAYLPHLAIGTAALIVGWTVPGTRPQRAAIRQAWPPAAVRTRQFWLTIAPAAPLVFGSVSVAIVVLPEEVTSAHSLSAGYAGLMTVLAFAPGIGIQPLARRLRAGVGLLAGVAAVAVGSALGAVAVAAASQPLAGLAAVFLGTGYGLCLVCGLRQVEHVAGDTDRGAVVACYYVLAYLGFAAPYAVDGLNAAAGQPATLAVLAGVAAILAVWLGWLTVRDQAPPAAARYPEPAEREKIMPLSLINEEARCPAQSTQGDVGAGVGESVGELVGMLVGGAVVDGAAVPGVDAGVGDDVGSGVGVGAAGSVGVGWGDAGFFGATHGVTSTE